MLSRLMPCWLFKKKFPMHHDIEIDYYDEDNVDDYNDHDDDDNDDDNQLNNTKKADMHDVVFFNRVPKVGSQSLMQLMTILGKLNGYKAIRDEGKARETVTLKKDEQIDLAIEILSHRQPIAYSMHVAHLNFTQLDLPKPIYVNLVRDPIERVVSWHYYIRAEWYYETLQLKLGKAAPAMPNKEFMQMDFDKCVKTNDPHCQFVQNQATGVGDHRRQTLFFCGQDVATCMPFNSRAALQRAKLAVESDYAVVGSWEYPNITLAVLEHYLPRYFRHATKTYYLNHDAAHTNMNKSKKPISEEVREIVRRNFTHEIDFYEFCKARLFKQYDAIKLKIKDQQ